MKSDNETSVVEIGIERPILIHAGKLPVGKRITVRVVTPGNPPTVEIARTNEIKEYWGFGVKFFTKPLGKVLKDYGANLVIATSRYGTDVHRIIDDLSKRWRESEKILILFGSPSEGLREILARENLAMGDVVDFVVNTIPKQAVQTVRTEEAIYATLSIFNVLMSANCPEAHN